MTHVALMDFAGNPNVGLFAFINDHFGLVGSTVDDDDVAKMSKILQIPFHKVSVAGTSLVGVFISGNNDKIIVPSIIFPEEEQVLKDLGIAYEVVDTKFTALGNNVIVNQKAILCHREVEEKVQQQISAYYGLPIQIMTIVDQDTVGSCLVLTTKGGIVHRDASDALIGQLSDYFGVNIEIGAVNMGVPQVASGLLANSFGFIIGSQSTGVEVTNTDEILGFLGEE